MPLNWHNQGSDAGLYSNDDIHAVRILVMEPTTDRHRGHRAGRLFFNHGNERLRILGEIPVRKFSEGGTQSRDPDGNPDTSFLAKIPADTAFTFQTLDARGMVLNMAQTWHQLRPGEMRTDCGGCHAHSQKPTEFSETEAGRRPESLWDLTENTPLVTERSRDESGRRWDEAAATGLRFAAGEALDVEYFHDIRPILDRSCVACHTRERDDPPAGLVLDADVDRERKDHLGEFPGTYYRLALDEEARYGHKPFGYDSWGYPNASRYVRKYQSRRSLLVWKIFGERLDGFLNSDHPSESEPGSGKLWWKGEPADGERYRAAWDLDFTGDEMPPAKAVAEGKVQPLSDEDRRTVVRWIDLGCPVDLSAGDPAQGRAQGWFGDDNRPVLTLQQPARGEKRIQRIVIGMHDYYSGIDRASFSVVANFPLEGAAAGENVAAQFRESAEGVWTWDLKEPAAVPSGAGETGVLTVSVRDVQGNETRVVRRWH
jgi:hypothetical protein